MAGLDSVLIVPTALFLGKCLLSFKTCRPLHFRRPWDRRKTRV